MQKEIDNLIAKKLSGNITPEEDSKLQKWISASADHATVFAEAERAWLAAVSLKSMPGEHDLDYAWNDLQKRISSPPAVRVSTGFYLRAAAAVIVVLLAILFLRLFITAQPETKVLVAATSQFTDTIAVPQTKLEQVVDSVVFDEPVTPTVTITKPAGKIKRSVPQIAMIAVSSEDSAMVFLLPDGSKIYLNSNSKLLYPEKFASTRNEIYLSGEAYVESAGGELLIYCHNTRTRLYGSALNIKGLRDGAVEISAIRGKALVEKRKPAGEAAIEINEGELLLYDAVSQNITKSRITRKHKWWKHKNFRTLIKEFFNRILHNDNKPKS